MDQRPADNDPHLDRLSGAVPRRARLVWLYPVWSAIGGVIVAIGAALVIVINRGGPLPVGKP